MPVHPDQRVPSAQRPCEQRPPAEQPVPPAARSHGEPWVDAGPFRAHLRLLMAVGALTVTEVATLAGVSPRMAGTLLHGRGGRAVRRIDPESARALLAVTALQARSLRSRQVPAAESQARLGRLLASGAGLPGLADQLEVAPAVLEGLADGSSSWCNGLLALRLVVALRAGSARSTAAGVAA
jgi:hypothetical protein